MNGSEHGERDARAYCRSLGLDPDETVWGYEHKGFGWVPAPNKAQWRSKARWRWYVGVSEAGLRRAI